MNVQIIFQVLMFYFLIILFVFIYFGCAGFSLLHVSFSLVVVCKLFISVASLLQSQALGRTDFSHYSTWAQWLWLPCSRAQAQCF